MYLHGHLLVTKLLLILLLIGWKSREQFFTIGATFNEGDVSVDLYSYYTDVVQCLVPGFLSHYKQLLFKACTCRVTSSEHLGTVLGSDVSGVQVTL